MRLTSTIRPLLAAFALAVAAMGTATGQNAFLTWTTWAAMQAVPSPGIVLDHGDGGTTAVGELRWQAVPLNYSFGANPLVSPAQFFIVNPLRRHSGSVEGFIEAGWALEPYRRSGDGRLGAAAGARLFLPLAEYGEELSMSVGGKYVVREGPGGGTADAAALELGVYTLFGILGAKADVSTDPAHRASFTLSLRYY